MDNLRKKSTLVSYKIIPSKQKIGHRDKAKTLDKTN